MKFRKGLVGVAAAMLVLGGAAQAQEIGGPENPELTQPGEAPPPAETPAAAPPQRAAIMNLLDRANVAGPLDRAGLNLYGYAEVGYLYDFTAPSNLTPPKTAPGDFIFFPGPYKNELFIDQVNLTLERAINPNGDNFDFGFKIAGSFGRDAFFTHSNGVLDQDNKAGGVSGNDEQFDIPEAYFTVNLPVGSGLLIEAGKFADLLGVEKINPTGNALYSHSYQFSYALPFTQTGVLAKYKLTSETNPDEWTTFMAGITRGWNQTLYDDNGVPDGLLQFSHHAGSITWTADLLFGPEGYLPYGPSDNHDMWVTADAIVSWQVSDELNLTFDGLVGNSARPTPLTGATTWAGIAGYADYVLGKHVTLNGRLEYYHDGHGVTSGIGGTDLNYYEATAGVSITPLPDNQWLRTLVLRPEVRLDWADQGVIDGSRFSQLTAAVDLYWKF